MAGGEANVDGAAAWVRAKDYADLPGVNPFEYLDRLATSESGAVDLDRGGIFRAVSGMGLVRHWGQTLARRGLM